MITLTAIWELLLDYFEVRKVLVIAPLRVARDTWPGELEKMCIRDSIRDVDVEKEIRRKLQHFPISESEMELYCLDQKINDRGVLVDRKLVQQAVSCDLLYKDVVTKRAYELTGLELSLIHI